KVVMAFSSLELISRGTFAQLFDVSLKATIVLAVALAAERLLRRRSAALRHLVLVLGLMAVCVLPFAERVLPRITTAWLPNVTPAAAATMPTPAAAFAKPELTSPAQAVEARVAADTASAKSSTRRRQSKVVAGRAPSQAMSTTS